MYFYDPSERETKELAPGINARTFWGENLLVSVVDLEPSMPLPEHKHPHEQAGVILAGSVEFTVAGETRTLTAGDLFIIPGDVPHSAVTGPDGAKVMDVFSPVREDLKY
jgi:unsaturated pyranuronate lyase